MRLDGYRCDACEKEDIGPIPNELRPPGWYRIDGSLKGDACSLDCLVTLAEKLRARASSYWVGSLEREPRTPA